MGMTEIRKRSCLILATVITMTNSSHAQEAPYSVKWKWDDLTEIKKIEFTVMTDKLTINDVIVNKGNCQIATNFDGAIELKVNDAVQQLGKVLSSTPIEKLPQKTDPKKGFPMSGKFGEGLGVFVARSCNIILVETKTDQGDWANKFEPK
jgi:hypothetical protein